MKGYRTGFILLYLFAVVGVTVCVSRPDFCVLSLVGALAADALMNGRAAARFALKFGLPVALITAAVNPLVNHLGVTVLFYLGNNPVTAEAMYYGLAMGASFAAVLVWFHALGRALTGEGFVALVGKVLPKTSLTLSIALGCEPQLKRDIRAISEARAALGEQRDAVAGRGKSYIRNTYRSVRHGLKTLDTAVGCALEDSVETAVAMRARGYGLRPRARYKPDAGGTVFFMLTVAFLAACVTGRCLAPAYSYYPVYVLPYTLADILSVAAFGALCLLAAAVRIVEEIKWRLLRSNI